MSKIISVSVTPDINDLLIVATKKLGCGKSELVRNLIDKYLRLLVRDNNDVPVILEVPADLQGSELRNWLVTKANAIADALDQ